ncbi:uncharacterized protein LOC143019120 [Oratosquilla oratoria]|uniref:uncharacterized protein LOC143019120 n=1 Tax=Oratosquilla oratoria TaxID=337810 RepID=UPI003F757733
MAVVRALGWDSTEGLEKLEWKWEVSQLLSTSTLALPQLSGTDLNGTALGECPAPGTSTKDAASAPHPSLLRRHPSLPTSPLFEDAQALRELLAAHRKDYLLTESSASRAVLDPADPYRYEYHAAQLDKFLQEYKNLQEQLYRMKESCEHMKKAGPSPRTDGDGAAVAATTSTTTTSGVPSSEAPRTPFDHKDLPAGGAAAIDSSKGMTLRGSEGGKGDGSGGGGGVRAGVSGTVGGSLRPSGSGEPLKSILKNRNEGSGGGSGGVGVYHLGNFSDDRTPLESAEEVAAGFSREENGIKHQDFEFYNS